MEQIKQLHTLKHDELDFIVWYIDQIKNLAECVMILSGSFGERSKDQCMLRIRNIDLWIDANKLKYPELLVFRLEVRKKMQECGLEPWPNYIYETSNHFKK